MHVHVQPAISHPLDLALGPARAVHVSNLVHVEAIPALHPPLGSLRAEVSGTALVLHQDQHVVEARIGAVVHVARDAVRVVHAVEVGDLGL